MKLKTSFFNKTIFKKDITRFSPVWILYTVFGLLLGFGNVVYGYDPQGWFARSIGVSIGILAIVNCGYALVVALCLFGDLFKGRLCNAIHALPVRREELFLTHTAAGMLFSLVPNTLMALLFMTVMGNQWFVALLWLLGMTVEYLFFFSLAAVCAVSTGSRFAVTAVYLLVNLLSMIVLWFVMTFYEPLLRGLHLRIDGFDLFSPVVFLAQNGELVKFREEQLWELGQYDAVYRFDGLGSGWWYLLVLGVLSFVLLGLGILLYRKRKLESAGDFVAFRPMVPVLSALFSLCIAAVLQAIGSEMSIGTFSLIVGLVLGCFLTEMLMRRTVKVFDKKTTLKCLAIGGAFGLTLLLTAIDPLGLTRWTPEEDEVESIILSDSYNYDIENPYQNPYTLTVVDREWIASLISIHEELIREGIAEADLQDYRSVRAVHLTYFLEDGTRVERRYYYDRNSEIGRELDYFWNSPKFTLGYEDWQAYLESVMYVVVYHEDEQRTFYDDEARELVKAINRDCKAGNVTLDALYDKSDWNVEICRLQHWTELALNGQCINSLQWLEANWVKVIE